jgi:parallel beta-helix repeat protein
VSDIRKTLILTFFFLFFFSLISNVYATLIPGCVDILRPGIYYLTQDIINSIDDVCIDIQADNVILDCQGHLIDGVGAPASIGILVHGLHITIMNCYLNDWYEGIYVVNSFSNSIINIHGDTVGAMVHLEASNDNTISNVEGGVHLQFSNHNTISDVSGGNPSVYLEASDDNTISNVEGGVHLEASNDNTISDVSGGNPSVYLEASNDNTISNVQAEGCWRGIDMRSSNNNEISPSKQKLLLLLNMLLNI